MVGGDYDKLEVLFTGETVDGNVDLILLINFEFLRKVENGDFFKNVNFFI